MTSLNITTSLDKVRISQSLIATFQFGADRPDFNTSHIDVSPGITKGALVTVSASEYTMELTMPSAGEGDGIVYVNENVVSGGNDAAEAQFEWFESLDISIKLSNITAGVGQTIIAQIDSDNPIPEFDSTTHLQVPSGFTKGAAESLNDNNTRWVVPIDLPSSGTGEGEIVLPENQFGLQYERQSSSVQYQAPMMPIHIGDRNEDLDEIGIKHTVIGEYFNIPIKIRGSNIRSVDVQGLLEPFTYDWRPETGTCTIRGNSKRSGDISFNVIASDSNTTANKQFNLHTSHMAPVILSYYNPIRRTNNIADLYISAENEILIEVENDPTKIEVVGTWLGLDDKLITRAGKKYISISGFIKKKLSSSFEFGVTRGRFTLKASNPGGDARIKNLQWRLHEIVDATWQDGFILSGQTRYFQRDVSRENMFIPISFEFNGNPRPTVELFEGSLPPGLDFERIDDDIRYYSNRGFNEHTIILTGDPTTDGTYKFKLLLKNIYRSEISSEYTIRVYERFVNPSRSSISPAPFYIRSRGQTEDFSVFFNRGLPPGTFDLQKAILQGDETGHDHVIDPDTGIVTFGTTSSGIDPHFRVICSNQHDSSFSDLFGIFII